MQRIVVVRRASKCGAKGAGPEGFLVPTPPDHVIDGIRRKIDMPADMTIKIQDITTANES